MHSNIISAKFMRLLALCSYFIFTHMLSMNFDKVRYYYKTISSI